MFWCGARKLLSVQAWAFIGTTRNLSLNTLPTFLNSASSLFIETAGNASNPSCAWAFSYVGSEAQVILWLFLEETRATMDIILRNITNPQVSIVMQSAQPL